jgi:hypothetical protein
VITPADVTVIGYRNGDYRDQFGPVALDAVVVDLTGCTLTMQIRDTPASPTSYADLDSVAPNVSGSVITITDGPGGVFEVYIAMADFDDVPEGVDASGPVALAYDIRIQKPAAGDIYPYIKGTFTLNHGVTR